MRKVERCLEVSSVRRARYPGRSSMPCLCSSADSTLGSSCREVLAGLKKMTSHFDAVTWDLGGISQLMCIQVL